MRIWGGVWGTNDYDIIVTNDQPPMYLASGDHHDIVIAPGPDMLYRWSKTPNEYLGAILTKPTDWGIGTLHVDYTDIYGQRGRTWCRVSMKTREARGEIVLNGAEMRLPGSDG